MSAVFDDVVLEWKGRDYIVQSSQVMRLIARIEDVITLSELGNYSNRGGVPIAKLCMAYGVALRHAGAKVTDDEIYNESLTHDQSGFIVAAVTNITMMMLPPAARQKFADADPDKIEPPETMPEKPPAPETALSREPIKSPFKRAG